MTSTKGTKEEIQEQLDEFGPADRPHYAMKPCSECKGMSEGDEVITAEEVEEPVEKTEVPSTQEVEAVAEQAAEEAVEEYMENGLFMNELDDTMPTASETEALVSEEVPQKESEVEPMYIDEKTEMVMDAPSEEDVVTKSDDINDMEDEELYMDEMDETSDFCNKTFSRSNKFVAETDYEAKYSVASIEELLGF
jgi:hypothetical protein